MEVSGQIHTRATLPPVKGGGGGGREDEEEETAYNWKTQQIFKPLGAQSSMKTKCDKP